MASRKNDESNLILNEKLSTPQMIWWIVGVMLVSGITGGLAGAREISWVTLIVIVITMALFGLGVLLSNVLFLNHFRLKMDATRIWTHIPLMKDRSLNWADVRTAAIITLSKMNYPTMIVLSVHAPEEALTRKRMMWKNPVRGEELRIPLSDSRRAAIEQILGMTLPEIEL